MEYNEAIEFLYTSMPAFERNGSDDYKPGLERVKVLDDAFSNPSRAIRTIHIAGTNGKGTTAHAMAAVLQAAGLKTGLFTSPHLVDFRERIRVNGEMIDADVVCRFVERYRSLDLGIVPSFFELTTVMAFEAFRDAGVDVAVIETGLGGRLDSTNIINPILSIITNIALDHTDLLGETLSQIAAEKGGIIKPGVPVVVSNVTDDAVRDVLRTIADERQSPITFANDISWWRGVEVQSTGALTLIGTRWGDVATSLSGDFQLDNLRGILAALQALAPQVNITAEAVTKGLGEGIPATGLKGRWMVAGHNPLTIIDTGHNPDAWRRIVAQLSAMPGYRRIVAGFVADKDVQAVIDLMAPLQPFTLYATAPVKTHRALPAQSLAEMARNTLEDVEIKTYKDVNEALVAARADATPCDVVFVGGSNYLVGQINTSI